jgi:hypothetical protein
MENSKSTKILHLHSAARTERHSAFVGTVAAIDDHGHVYVNFAANSGDPIRALIALSQTDRAALWERDPDISVLLVNPDHPDGHLAIIGLLSETLSAPAEETDESDIVHLDVTSLVLEARKDLVLRCGDSQLTMKANGKIVLRGTDVVSRSSGPTRIRGASVRIN